MQMGLGCRNKVNIGKIRPQLQAERSPRFLAWLVERSNTKCCHCFGPGLIIYKTCTLITPNAAGRGEGGKSVSSLTAPGPYPLLITETSWPW